MFPLLIAAASSLLAFPQDRVGNATQQIIPSALSCEGCSLRVTKIAALGGTRIDDGQICHDHASVVIDSAGQYYVAPTCRPGEILVFSSLGDRLRALTMPNEIASVQRLWVSPDDRVHAYGFGRGYVRFSPIGEVEEIRIDQVSPGDVLFHNTEVSVHAATIHTATSIGQPLHVVGRDGQTLRSFGRGPRIVYSRPELSWRLARLDERGFWAAERDNYRIHRWTLRGELEETLVREADWFSRLGPPAPFVQDIRYDSEGLLWTIVTIPAGPASIADPQLTALRFHSVIEVLDPRRASLLAMHRTPHAFWQWVDDRVFTYRGLPGGFVAIDVFHVELARPKGERGDQPFSSPR
jgi:hypothetical protein